MIFGLILTLALFAPGDDSNSIKDDNIREELSLKEADAIVRLYEARLVTSRVRAKHYRIDRDHAKDFYLKYEELHKTRAVSTNSYLAAKKSYDKAEVDMELGDCDVQECVAELNLVKVRRDLASRGFKVRTLKIDKIDPTDDGP